MEIGYDFVKTDEQIFQIMDLQQQNLKKNIDSETMKAAGFVTVEHNYSKLKTMQEAIPQVIAVQNNKVVAYALSMNQASKQLIPELSAMFELFAKIEYKGKFLTDYNFYVMGQICVAEAVRGQGVFDGLYAKHKELFANKFDYLITEVSLSNTRSMRAHQRVGFEIVFEYYDATNNDTWAVVLLKL